MDLRGPNRGVNLKEFYPSRSKNARKGDFGRVIVCGGSDRYAGCLAFNSLAALRAGTDLAIVVAPKRAADIVAGYSPDLITVPCDSSFPDPNIAIELLENANALVVGCGVTRTPESHRALLDIIQRCKTPMVLDAEALHALAPNAGSIKGKQVLLTPNVGEYQVLSGRSWPQTPEAQRTAVKTLASQYDATAIVKGAPDIVSDGERTYVDPRGSPYMTKGGYGDLLAGVAGAHLARGRTPFDAARIAAFIVGRAGELASAKFGESTLASDVLQFFSSVIPSSYGKGRIA
ncbi:MAG: NAD(P)H-hydrate dehydratase [Crenarchaeota archaeon 13_1_20CM_2_51_8]|nr:MAG: NAD(P)H-hydrate dehydratase [Crenarchaeota archaeon 13_1_20CM_2_51_8]